MSGRSERGKAGAVAFFKGKGRLLLLVGGALLGILLLFMGGGSETDTEAVSEPLYESAEDLAAYQKKLEAEISALCDAVAGVGHVDVMVTLGSGCRVVYMTDEKGTVATTGNGSGEKPIYSTLRPPAVAGVGIVCRNGENPHVQKTLAELVSTTLGVPMHKVYVTGR